MKVHDIKDKMLRTYAMNVSDVLLKFVEVDDILEDLWAKDDPVINDLVDCIKKASFKYDNPRYQRLTFRIGIYALWVCVMDEAYNEFLWELLYQIATSDMEFDLREKIVDPKDWRVNRIWRKQRERKS
ncbi:MAG TPA: hypothetical protein ENL13_03175 [Thermoplasmatales archaeon]|nr:hypothetical protein [Thermoplasmatales archaeon]